MIGRPTDTHTKCVGRDKKCFCLDYSPIERVQWTLSQIAADAAEVLVCMWWPILSVVVSSTRSILLMLQSLPR